VVGFTVIDLNYGFVGLVETIIDLQVNPLIQILNGEKEVLIPLVEGVVQEVDRANKILKIAAPAGLIELYLS
jgi:16S rRNA processing protein RimM